MKTIITILVLLVLITGATFLAILSNNGKSPLLGSITTGQEYTATTTPDGLSPFADGLIREGWGTLGSVIITKTGDLDYTLFDATSTGAVLNDSRFNRGDKQLARIGSNLAAGTYVFDVTYTDGLVLDVTAGSTGTSTITYR